MVNWCKKEVFFLNVLVKSGKLYVKAITYYCSLCKQDFYEREKYRLRETLIHLACVEFHIKIQSCKQEPRSGWWGNSADRCTGVKVMTFFKNLL